MDTIFEETFISGVGNIDKKVWEEAMEKSKNEKAASGQVLDSENKILDLSKLRVTDLPTVTRVFEPRPAADTEEVKIQVQRLEALGEISNLLGRSVITRGS